MHNRKIISVAVTEAQHKHVMRYCKDRGFATVSELLRAMFGLLIWRDFDVKHEQEESDYIREMFDEYSNSQRQPDGTVPVRHHKTQLK